MTLPNTAEGAGVALRNIAGSAGALTTVTVSSTSGPRRSSTAARIRLAAGNSGAGACARGTAAAATTASAARACLPDKVVHLLQHLVGSLDVARVRFICSLADDHVDHLFNDADVRVFENTLCERAARVGAGRARLRFAGRRCRREQVAAERTQTGRVGERRDLNR